MKYILPMSLLLAFSGCICCGGAEGIFEKPETSGVVMPEPVATTPTIPPEMTYPPATQQTTIAYSTSLPETTTQPPHTTSTLKSPLDATPSYDKSTLSVQLAGCDDDYYGNAMVAGYVSNLGQSRAENVFVVAELQDAGGKPIPQGSKTLIINHVDAKMKVKFSTVFEKPSTWKKCRAYIK